MSSMTTRTMINRNLFAGNAQARPGHGVGAPGPLGSFSLRCRKWRRVLLNVINSISRRWMLMNTHFNVLPRCNHRSVNRATLFFAFGFIALAASSAYGYEYKERREITSYMLRSHVDLAEGIHANVSSYDNGFSLYGVINAVKIDTISCDDYVTSLDLPNSIPCEVDRRTTTYVDVYHYRYAAASRDEYEYAGSYCEGTSESPSSTDFSFGEIKRLANTMVVAD